ncbi:MAG: peptidoglycan editing factor PgeF [Deltaproteobacteria bacterium]|nr:peptidoglycan editing factor PgeF [Deltaproteobacteria bacterium]
MPAKDNGIFHILSAALGREPGCVHAFLGRTGGTSRGPFSSLNMGLNLGDKIENVKANRALAGRRFGFAPARLATVRQVHGDNVVTVESSGARDYTSVEADAIITAVQGAAVGVLTADCLPILIFDPGKRAAAAVHAGWRGTVRRVAERAVCTMIEKFGSDAGGLRASLGPSIGPCCYVVGKDVTDEFKKAFGRDAERYVKAEGRDSARVDIRGANMLLLKEAGLREENIGVENICTSCRNDVFFSYRKDGKDTGRQLSFIMVGEDNP